MNNSHLPDGPLLIPVVPHGPGVTGWFKQNIAGTLLTVVVSGAMGFVASWYTIQDKVEHDTQRIVQLELNTVRRSELDRIMDGIVTQNNSINSRLGNIEGALMRERDGK